MPQANLSEITFWLRITLRIGGIYEILLSIKRDLENDEDHFLLRGLVYYADAMFDSLQTKQKIRTLSRGRKAA